MNNYPITLTPPIENRLISAIRNQEFEGVKNLLATGEKINYNLKYPQDQNNMYKDNPLYWALKKGNNQIIHALLDAGAAEGLKYDPKLLPIESLADAILADNIRMIELMLDAGVNVNQRIKSDEKYVLNLAIILGDNIIAKMLIEAGADVDPEVEDHSYHPLIIALKNNNLETVKMLIEAGADVDPEVESYYNYPLIIALKHNNLELVKMLIEAGANVNFESFIEPPIQETNNLEIKKLMLKAGAKSDPLDEDTKALYDTEVLSYRHIIDKNGFENLIIARKAVVNNDLPKLQLIKKLYDLYQDQTGKDINAFIKDYNADPDYFYHRLGQVGDNLEE